MEKYDLKQAKGADSSTWHARPPTIFSQSTHTSLLHVREDVPERKNEQNLLQINYLGNSPKIICDFWRGITPGLASGPLIQPAGKRLKIIDMEYHVETHAMRLYV